MQFEYQADQLLIKKMVFLLKDQEGVDGVSPGTGEHKNGQTVPATPDPSAALIASERLEPGHNGSATAAPNKKDALKKEEMKDKKGKDKGKSSSGGFLGLLKNKKNAEGAKDKEVKNKELKKESYKEEKVRKKEEKKSKDLKEKMKKEADKSKERLAKKDVGDAHKEVRKALAMEAQRLRGQGASRVDGPVTHPRFSPTAPDRAAQAHSAPPPAKASNGQAPQPHSLSFQRAEQTAQGTPASADQRSHQEKQSSGALLSAERSGSPIGSGTHLVQQGQHRSVQNGASSPQRGVQNQNGSVPTEAQRGERTEKGPPFAAISPVQRGQHTEYSHVYTTGSPVLHGRRTESTSVLTTGSPTQSSQSSRQTQNGSVLIAGSQAHRDQLAQHGSPSAASRQELHGQPHQGALTSAGFPLQRNQQNGSIPPAGSPAQLGRQPQKDRTRTAAESAAAKPSSPQDRLHTPAGSLPGSPASPASHHVKPAVQMTEHLLQAERTTQKPPLPHKASSAAKTSPELTSALKKGKTYCQSCKKKCSGEVLRVQDKYFHIACFKCKVCRNSLAQGGFFCKDGGYFCTADYQRQFGTKCAVCGEYVEGEVVSALGNTYHQKCFTCGRCRQPFPSGERVTYTGKEVLCARCVQIPVRESTRLQSSGPSSPTSANGSNECAGCHEELKECQALIALDRQWHIWCFKCKECDAVLHGEYMGKDGVPYCEKDYQKKFGVKCAYCNRYISGKVLQAGDNHHFHPTCARCTKCGDPFGDGEEMYLQGGAIWHPRCGPGPTENGAVLNGVENGHCTDTETEAESGRDTAFDRMSSSAVSDMQFSIRSRTPSLNGSFNSLSRKYQYQRTGSPGLILREYKQHHYPEDISRIYTYSYLTEEPTQGYLKRPIDPYDKPPTSPHFHRPSSAHSGRGSKLTHLSKHGSRSGMAVLVDSIRSETPRPRSPHMNNEEPIELAHFPAAKPPQPGDQPKIEREDFPAPPYPYTDPERRRRWSDSYKGVPISDDEDEADGKTDKETEDQKLKKITLQREEQELSKIATGIGKVFLHNVREREKLRQWKMSHVDPRNASRTPSAAREPTYRLRYQSPVNASPSRNVDHPRPWEEDEMMDRSSSYRSSVGRSVGAIPSYNVVSSLRSPPKPGYGLRSCTLPAAGRNGGHMGYPMSPDQGDFSFSGLGEKTHSTEFSSGKSDISAGSISEVDRRALNVELPVSTTYTGGLGALRSASYSPHLRRSLPNMTHANPSEPPKIYPYHLLVITNYRLPADVDRCNLERHLSDAEFEVLFGCSRVDFYRMPQWRRNDMKRRIRLF